MESDREALAMCANLAHQLRGRRLSTWPPGGQPPEAVPR
jgi:hypothetical protein